MLENIYAYSVMMMAQGKEVSVRYETKNAWWKATLAVLTIETGDIVEAFATKELPSPQTAELSLDAMIYENLTYKLIYDANAKAHVALKQEQQIREDEELNRSRMAAMADEAAIQESLAWEPDENAK